LGALLAEGLGGLVVPTEYGGLGLGLRGLVEVCEVIGTADASSGLCFGMHCVGSACIAAKANLDQAERLLRPIAAGEHLTTLALSEPGTGSHFYLPETTMAHAGDHYVVSGTKAFVTNGGHADSYVASTVATEPDAPPGHFSMVLIDADTPGMEWGGPWEGWGMRANSSRSLELRDVAVPLDNRLGDEGDQIWYVFNVVVPYFLIAMAGTYLGIAHHAVREATAHLRGRAYTHSGRRLAEFDVLQHRIGTLWAALRRTQQLCHWAADAADQGSSEALPAVCAAKAEVATATVSIVNECMTLVGGTAYRDGSVLQRLLRDARASHVMSPTTDILYTWAGRALLDLPLLGGMT
jgi:alkylation response protein AidB-like acyl-CoA dehydrogenase